MDIKLKDIWNYHSDSSQRKHRPDIEGIYDYMIKGDVLVDMPLKALKERINGHGRKIVNKKFNDADSFYISHKKVPKVIPRTPEPHK